MIYKWQPGESYQKRENLLKEGMKIYKDENVFTFNKFSFIIDYQKTKHSSFFSSTQQKSQTP